MSVAACRWCRAQVSGRRRGKSAGASSSNSRRSVSGRREARSSPPRRESTPKTDHRRRIDILPRRLLSPPALPTSPAHPRAVDAPGRSALRRVRRASVYVRPYLLRDGVINVLTTAYRSTARRLHVICQRVRSFEHNAQREHHEKTSIVSGLLETAPPRSLNDPRGARTRTDAAAAARGRYSDATAPRFVLPSPSVHSTSIECTGLVVSDLSLWRETRDACMFISLSVRLTAPISSFLFPAETLRCIFGKSMYIQRKSFREFTWYHE